MISVACTVQPSQQPSALHQHVLDRLLHVAVLGLERLQRLLLSEAHRLDLLDLLSVRVGPACFGRVHLRPMLGGLLPLLFTPLVLLRYL